MYNKKVPKNYMYSLPEEPLRPMRPARPIGGYDRERIIRPRRYIGGYTGPSERIVRGGMRGAPRGSRNPRDSWEEYSARGRILREEVGLRGRRGSARGDYWGIRGREIRDWRRASYSELGRRERRPRDDIGFRGRGMNMRGMRGGRVIRSRGIQRGPRGYSPSRRDGRG
ncbi:hypothetical protein C1645_749574 [Glomus cerebriforme]|uniref:Uncharacterized protein n=1 Tax=Glomus cerebriforme TaxID=658196 RepID=A0A397TTT4_9GLOM|nr:hypothetical protein C1645_749574 [Glomus cerebriforme]